MIIWGTVQALYIPLKAYKLYPRHKFDIWWMVLVNVVIAAVGLRKCYINIKDTKLSEHRNTYKNGGKVNKTQCCVPPFFLQSQDIRWNVENKKILPLY